MREEAGPQRPYPGLRPFESWESEIFFGRESHTDRLLEILGNRHFLSVIGPSGCGKSSLVRAGLLPALPLGAIGTGSDWRIALLRPGNRPIRRLAEALLREDVLRRELLDIDPALLSAQLRDDPTSLCGLVDQIGKRDASSDFNLLVLVDQFEEIFTYADAGTHQSDESDAFVHLLLDCAGASEARVFAVLTMRIDFLGNCVRFDDLPEAINRGQYLTPRMTREQLREAIRGPAMIFGGTIDELLVEELINGIADNPDQLPVLQHALARMWSLASRRAPPLRIGRADEAAIGGVGKALETHANEIFERLDAAAQVTAEWLFRAITDLPDAQSMIRRPRSLGDITRWSRVEPSRFVPVIESCLNPEVCFLTASGPLDDPGTVIDISHEALIRQWSRLKDWISNEARRGAEFRRLRESAADYFGGNRDALLKGLSLERAKHWRKGGFTPGSAWQPTPEWAGRYDDRECGLPDLGKCLAFLDASRRAVEEAAREEEERRQRERDLDEAKRRAQLESEARQRAEQDAAKLRKLQRWLSGSAVALLVLLCVTAWSLWQVRQAAMDAKQAAMQATIGRLALEGQAMVNGERGQSPLLGFQEALAAYRLAASGGKDFERVAPDALAALQAIHLQNTRLVRLFSADRPLTAFALSHDGKHIATGGPRGTLNLWDLATGSQIGETRSGHQERITSLAFSPDDRSIVSGSWDATLRLWNAHDLQPIGGPLEGHTGRVESVDFHPDPKRMIIVSGSADGTLRLWDAVTHEELEGTKPASTANAIHRVTFSPDGLTIASGGQDGMLRLWNADTLRAIHRPHESHQGGVLALAFSPDGRRIVSGGEDDSLRLWDADTLQAIGEPLTGHSAAVYAVDFSPDGRRIVSGGEDNTLRLWDVETGAPLGEPIAGHLNRINGAAFSPDGKQVVSGSFDRTVRVWDAAGTDKRPDMRLAGHQGDILAAAFSPDAKRVVTAHEDQSLRIRDAENGQPVGNPLTGHTATINAVGFSADGKRIASGGDDLTVRIWDAETGQPVGNRLTGHTKAIHAVALSPDGKQVASGDEGGILRVWDIASGSVIRTVPVAPASQVRALAFSTEGARIVSGLDDGTVRVVDLATGSEHVDLGPDNKHWRAVESVAFSPDGGLVASGGRDFTVRLWNGEDGTAIGKPLYGHSHWVNGVAFSADGKYLVSASEDKTLRLWNVRIPMAIGQPLAATDAQVLGAFRPDRRRIVSLGADGRLSLWPVLDSWADLLCNQITRNMTCEEWREHVSPTIPHQQQCPGLPSSCD